ncbi:hypothetical protein CRYUN_Cryun05aG0126700 [Craigia yunnanensis]
MGKGLKPNFYFKKNEYGLMSKIFHVDSDPYIIDEQLRNKDLGFIQEVKNGANALRAVTESLLYSHFGDVIIDKLFIRLAAHLADYLSKKKKKPATIVVSLTKKS